MKSVTLVYPSRDKVEGTTWDLPHIIGVLIENGRIIALSTFGSLMVAVVYVLLAPRIYSSRAVIYVEQRDEDVVNIQAVDPEDLEAMEVMKTVEQSLCTDSVMLAVIHANHLGDLPEFGGGDSSRPVSDDQLIIALNKRVSIKVRRGTRLIDIVASSRDPLLAQALARSFVYEYLNLNAKQRDSTASMANEFLAREADRLKARLEVSEHMLESYREQHHAPSLIDRQNIVVDSLMDLNSRLDRARAERIRIEADYNQYKRIGDSDPEALLAIATVGSSPLVLQAQRDVDEQRGELAALSHRYRAEHPKFIEAQSHLKQLVDDYLNTILTVAAGMRTAYQSALDNEKKLVVALSQQEQISSDLNKIGIPYNSLLQNVQADRDTYQTVINRLKETDVTRQIDENPIRLIETPRLTTRPVSPKVPLVLALGVFLGAGLGISICLVLHSLDTSFRSIEEAEKALKLPVIAAVPRLKDEKAASAWKSMPLINEPHSATAEAFRSLRTVMELADDADRQVFLITSALPHDGKTFCSTNAAVALAQQGYRTLLIDTDLRSPSIAEALHTRHGAPGLVEFLTGACGLEESIQSTAVAGLSVITAGTGASNPCEMLSGHQFARIFKDPAIAGFQRIILDTPPVNAVSDALSLVKFATSTCLVVRAGQTPAGAAIRTLAALAGARVMRAGIVLNYASGIQYHTDADRDKLIAAVNAAS
jgi:capsular exopolysaccharide synthesis family protein